MNIGKNFLKIFIFFLFSFFSTVPVETAETNEKKFIIKTSETINDSSSDTIVIDNAELCNINFSSDTEYSAHLEGNIIIRYKDVKFFSDSLSYIPASSMIYSDTFSRIDMKESNLEMRQFIYFLNSRVNSFQDVKFSYQNWIVRVKKLEIKETVIKTKPTKIYSLQHGKFTTCDHECPHYHISAYKAKFAAGEYISATSAFLKIGKIPIFYIPYYRHLFSKQPFNIEPGLSKNEGLLLFTEYHLDFSKFTGISIFNDYYNYRGYGAGSEFTIESPEIKSNLFGYTINEKTMLYNTETGKYSKLTGRRGRWAGRFEFKGNFQKNIYVSVDGRKYSDYLFEKDYKERGLGYILNDYKTEASIGQIYENLLWRITFDRKDIREPNKNNFIMQYQYFPEFKIEWNKIHLPFNFYYQPQMSVTCYQETEIIKYTEYNAAQYFSKKIFSFKPASLSITTGCQMSNAVRENAFIKDRNTEVAGILKTDFQLRGGFGYSTFSHLYNKSLWRSSTNNADTRLVISDKIFFSEITSRVSALLVEER